MSALAQLVAQSIHDRLATPGARRVAAFTVLYDEASANVWRNYAVPDSGAEPSAADVAALVGYFKTVGRTPRLEYVPSDAPAVEPALIAAGFEVEGRPPLMACHRGDLTAAPEVDGIDIRTVDSPDDLLDTARVQNAAYSSFEPAGPDDVARLQNTIRCGGAIVLARDALTGEPVGGGLVTEPANGVSELAAVGVIESHRRRGIATAVTAALTIAAFERRAETVWLEPAGPREAAIYARAGFQPDGQKLWISLPPRREGQPPVSIEAVSVETARSLLDGDLSGIDAVPGWPHENTMAAMWMAANQGAELWFAVVDGQVIGEGGTVGPPSPDGAVEIGYGLASAYESRSGDLAAALTGLVSGRPGVSRVIDTMTASGADAGPPEVDGSEAETLMVFIGYLRNSLIAKASGLSDQDARRALVPSGTSLLGLLKHVAHIEVFWLHQAFAGQPADLMPDDRLTDSDTVASVNARWHEIAAASDAIAAANPDLTTRAKAAEFRSSPTTLRWILVHLVEEMGRHAGHADIIREQIDGVVGR